MACGKPSVVYANDALVNISATVSDQLPDSDFFPPGDLARDQIQIEITH